VTSAFILPLAANYLKLQLIDFDELIDLTDFWAIIDVATGAVVDRGPAIEQVFVHRSPGRYMRVGLQYLLTEASTSVSLEILGYMALGAETYLSTGADLFAIAGLQHTLGAGLSPYIPTDEAPATCGATTLTFTLDTALDATYGTLAAAWHLTPNGVGGDAATKGNTLLTIDGDDLYTMGDTGYTFLRGAATVSYPCTEADLTVALGYVDDRMRQFSNQQNTINTFLPGTAFSGAREITIGSAPGYFKSLVAYPEFAGPGMLEFLTGNALV
jgi:hypothetical protein